MNESIPQESSKFADKYIENAYRTQKNFLNELNSATSLEEVQQIIHDHASVNDDESFLFHFVEHDDVIDGTTYSEDELISGITSLREMPIEKESDILDRIQHPEIADAVIRIMAQS
jgi:hypothetical protein